MRPHLSINVRNIGDSIAFYSRIFGTAPQKHVGTYAKFDLKEPSLNFSMHEVSESRRLSQVNHLGIEVSSMEELGRWQRRIAELGIKTVSETGTDCCYALQDKFWFRDPDGNAWEVFFVHAQLAGLGAQPPAEEMVSQGTACAAGSGCC